MVVYCKDWLHKVRSFESNLWCPSRIFFIFLSICPSRIFSYSTSMNCLKFLLNTLLIADGNRKIYIIMPMTSNCIKAAGSQSWTSHWIRWNRELIHINDWLIANKLKPNVGKYKFQIIGTKNQLSKINDIEQIKLDIGEECIRPEDTVVNLGMTLDQYLLNIL